MFDHDGCWNYEIMEAPIYAIGRRHNRNIRIKHEKKLLNHYTQVYHIYQAFTPYKFIICHVHQVYHIYMYTGLCNIYTEYASYTRSMPQMHGICNIPWSMQRIIHTSYATWINECIGQRLKVYSEHTWRKQYMHYMEYHEYVTDTRSWQHTCIYGVHCVMGVHRVYNLYFAYIEVNMVYVSIVHMWYMWYI